MRTLLSWIAAVTFLVIAGGIDAHAAAERRVALVVGNSTYSAAGLSLPNPINDAQDMTAALESLGFEVVTAIDATKRKMDLALQQFARLAITADSALFFYAGHAMQHQGRNYLMPTDAELQDEVSVSYEMVSLEYVRGALDRTKGVRIMILDACRNNPLAARLQKSVQGLRDATIRGLAPVDKAEGMVVAFATAAEEVAQDGTGRNSPFTSALLKRLQEPVDIAIMLRHVTADVNTQTHGRQRPETQITLLSEYYLNQNGQDAIRKEEEQKRQDAIRKEEEKLKEALRKQQEERIRQAQVLLNRLGCFNGAPTGKLDDATKNAVRALWRYTGKPDVEINIVTDEFIADLKQQPDRVCVPASQQAHPREKDHPNNRDPKPARWRPLVSPPPVQSSQPPTIGPGF
jgi:uncharacterized caspase-like protein